MSAQRNAAAVVVAAAAVVVATAACGKGGGGYGVAAGADVHTQQGSSAVAGGDPGQPAAEPQPVTTTAADPNRPFGDDPVSWLDARFEVELPRSTAPQPVDPPWTLVTPTAPAAADGGAAPPEPQRVFTGPVVLVGRQKVFVSEAAVLHVQCTAEPAELCKPDALRASTGKQRLRLSADAVAADGTIAALQAALQAQGAAGKAVWVLADRRVDAQAVVQVLAAVERAGGRPLAGTATLAGHLAPVFPDPAGVSAPATATATVGESGGSGPVPTDLQGVSVQVRRTGVTLLFERPVPQPPATPELLGNVAEALSVWAERARAVAPSVTRARIQADADAPWEEVVRVADALRDACARAAKGTPCHDQRALFATIDLVVEAAAPATATAR
ncbi:MAG: hypothetical protein FJ100_10860 [Deltaproteobacteria bacterium]|nr:hypothetical protein [Deltaproteobacteria bacterium]